jgi:hypothetical protein
MRQTRGAETKLHFVTWFACCALWLLGQACRTETPCMSCALLRPPSGADTRQFSHSAPHPQLIARTLGHVAVAALDPANVHNIDHIANPCRMRHAPPSGCIRKVPVCCCHCHHCSCCHLSTAQPTPVGTTPPGGLKGNQHRAAQHTPRPLAPAAPTGSAGPAAVDSTRRSR